MSDNGAWTEQRFAQELVARGTSPTHAISVVRAFDREWRPEAARQRALEVFWNQHLKDEEPKDPAKRRDWLIELGRMARQAGEKAAAEQLAIIDEVLR